MLDEDQDTLAAEYVLGTLSAEEREHAESLLTFDTGFEAAVRQWERRLGELNVMVEAVEPPAELWDKIKTEVSPAEPSDVLLATEAVLPRDLDVSLAAEAELPRDLDASLATEAELPRDLDEPSAVDVVESDLSSLEPASEPTAPADTEVIAPAETPLPAAGTQKIERGADVIYLAKRVRRWRRVALGIGAIAALLAFYVAVWQIAPNLVPVQLRPAGSELLARSEGSARTQQDRLVAVLQQQPMAPAFLLTFDTQHRTLTVRRVSATPEAGKSYELWLISNRLGAPRSLGVVGADEFTQRALPGNYDVDTLRTASYAVSLEPLGGSKSNAPTGPVLFTGKAVESLPAAPPASPAKT